MVKRICLFAILVLSLVMCCRSKPASPAGAGEWTDVTRQWHPQRRGALQKETAAWKRWIDYRAGIAPRLPASFRPAFDHATRAICRRKLIALKNRYQCFGYQSQEFVDELLPFDCSDEQLAAYNYEQVFKDLL